MRVRLIKFPASLPLELFWYRMGEAALWVQEQGGAYVHVWEPSSERGNRPPAWQGWRVFWPKTTRP